MSEFPLKVDRESVVKALGDGKYDRANQALFAYFEHPGFTGDGGKEKVRDLILAVDFNVPADSPRQTEPQRIMLDNFDALPLDDSSTQHEGTRLFFADVKNRDIGPVNDFSEHLPELALAYAESKFDAIHEPNSLVTTNADHQLIVQHDPGKGVKQITKPDLERYEQTHTLLGPMEKVFTHYLENNFDKIRNLDQNDEGGFLSIGAHNAAGITLSDLQKGGKLISDDLQALQDLPHTTVADKTYSVSEAEIKFLQSHYGEIAAFTARLRPQSQSTTDTGFDKFDFDRFLECNCQADDGTGKQLQGLSGRFTDILSIGSAASGVLTADVLQRALTRAHDAEANAQSLLQVRQASEEQKRTSLTATLLPFYDYSKL